LCRTTHTGVAYETFGGRFELAPDLANTNFVAGYNFVKNNEHANDDDGHGTHVTGTIAQSTNNGIGVAGIAFNCSIMPVKVLASRGQVASGSHADIASGIYFAADNGAHVINMSLGGPSGSNTLRDAVAYAYNQGVTIICSAGNSGAGAPASYPAAYDAYCIAVGATRYDKTKAPYSTTGSFVDLAAPGGDTDPNLDQNGDGYADGILQQTFDRNPKDWGYWFFQGTSMSAPHVSAVAALLISTGVTHPDDVREALEATAEDLGTPGWDAEYGWGFIDAYAALNYFDVTCDFNLDGVVNFKDLRTLLNSWLADDPLVDIAPAGGEVTALLTSWILRNVLKSGTNKDNPLRPVTRGFFKDELPPGLSGIEIKFSVLDIKFLFPERNRDLVWAFLHPRSFARFVVSCAV
jgi:subtilisin family serine protease